METQVEQFIKDYDGGTNAGKLPSKLQPGDKCYVNVHSDQYLFAKIVAIKFTVNKVLYDVDVQVDITTASGAEIEYTRFHGLSGDVLFSTDQRDNLLYKSSLVNFGNFIMQDVCGKKDTHITYEDIKRWRSI